MPTTKRKPTKKPAAKSKAAPKKKAATSKVRLLSGGNPQIAKGEGDAPVQAYISAAPDWKGLASHRIDVLISRAVPFVRKAVKWNSPFYGVPGQGWFLNFHCFNKYIKVAFFKGVELKPALPGLSKHKEVRYLDIYEGGFDEKQFESWVKQAAAIPGWIAG